jgi:hypothetical protein
MSGMSLSNLSMGMAGPTKGVGDGLPALPPGYAFLVTAAGEYIVTSDGSYIIVEA